MNAVSLFAGSIEPMPRWPEEYVRKSACPRCGGRKQPGAASCRSCKRPEEWAKPQLGRAGPVHSAWRGGRRIDKDGYVRLYLPSHPWPRKSGYVPEHVAIIELEIGRRLAGDEIVHHRDGDPANNKRSNLELMHRGGHSSLHRHNDVHRRLRDASGRFL